MTQDYNDLHATDEAPKLRRLRRWAGNCCAWTWKASKKVGAALWFGTKWLTTKVIAPAALPVADLLPAVPFASMVVQEIDSDLQPSENTLQIVFLGAASLLTLLAVAVHQRATILTDKKRAFPRKLAADLRSVSQRTDISLTQNQNLSSELNELSQSIKDSRNKNIIETLGIFGQLIPRLQKELSTLPQIRIEKQGRSVKLFMKMLTALPTGMGVPLVGIAAIQEFLGITVNPIIIFSLMGLGGMLYGLRAFIEVWNTSREFHPLEDELYATIEKILELLDDFRPNSIAKLQKIFFQLDPSANPAALSLLLPKTQNINAIRKLCEAHLEANDCKILRAVDQSRRRGEPLLHSILNTFELAATLPVLLKVGSHTNTTEDGSTENFTLFIAASAAWLGYSLFNIGTAVAFKKSEEHRDYLITNNFQALEKHSAFLKKITSDLRADVLGNPLSPVEADARPLVTQELQEKMFLSSHKIPVVTRMIINLPIIASIFSGRFLVESFAQALLDRNFFKSPTAHPLRSLIFSLIYSGIFTSVDAVLFYRKHLKRHSSLESALMRMIQIIPNQEAHRNFFSVSQDFAEFELPESENTPLLARPSHVGHFSGMGDLRINSSEFSPAGPSQNHLDL